MNILVTGGAGFIGSHVVEKLLSSGHQVTILDNLSTGKECNLSPESQLVMGDVRDGACVDRCVQGQDVVFHLAAYTSVPGSLEYPQVCLETNLEGTRNLLESSCRWGVRRVIFSSTSAVYPGHPDTPKSETTPPEPASPYAASKLEGEALLEWFHQHRGLSYVALRYFNVYGPRQDAESDYASVIPAFISMSQMGETLTIYGDGHQTRDFVYVDDVVQANLQAMESEVCGIFNVGTTYAVSILCLAKAVVGLMGSKSDYTFAEPRPGDVFALTADISLISSGLGWTPRWDLRSGLTRTIDWSRSQSKLEVESRGAEPL